MDSELYIRAVGIDRSAISPDSYLHRIPAIAAFDGLTLQRRVTFFVGENGTGKSTMLEALAVSCGFNPEGGTMNYHFSTYDSHSELCDALRLIRSIRRPAAGYFLRAESFYNVATADEEYGKLPGGVSHDLHKMSHGESFLTIALNNFRADGIYFLDEPEAALSPQRQMALMLTIAKAANNGAQFVIATHSPIILALPDAEIISFDDGRLHPCAYEETSSYQITKMFIDDRRRMIKHLFEDDD
ncbi:MAG: AAA family ATPase [Ruminococcus sp.]|nr:AAA family ATPase [Ruminococcus sp.]